MKVLILGATGMLGHKLMQVLAGRFTVTGTVRKGVSDYTDHPILGKMTLIEGVTADDLESVTRAVEKSRPDLIINCIGIVKQLPTARDPLPSIAINALFPHQLAQICQKQKIRMIHMSTDCVFSGNKGKYTEEDPSDAEDLYGKSKFLGEVDYPGCLTIRTSIIGRELDSAHGLVEWFLHQRGKTIQGYKKAIFSGLTTNALAEIIGTIIESHPELHGVWQVAAEPISKYDLLMLLKLQYQTDDIVIEPDESVISDRSLNGSRFSAATTITVPSWPVMIEQLYRDPTPYNTERSTDVHR